MTTENENALTKIMTPKKWGVGARRDQAKKILEELDPKTMPTKLAIVFDDSGSMGSRNVKDTATKIDDAKSGIRNFSSQCNPRDTALAVYPLNVEAKPLTCNFDLLNLLVSGINATGGTPLYTVTLRVLESEDKYTRAILFSDGSPTDSSSYYYPNSGNDNNDDDENEQPKRESIHDKVIRVANEQKCPLDTVYIGEKESSGYDLMKELADKTGGIFIHFTDSASLSQNLKYLAPALRGILMNAELKAKIERGETI